MKIMFVFTLLFSVSIHAAESKCFGRTSNGRLENGVRLPLSGENFISYSTVLSYAGRTYVHSAVKDIMIDSYSNLNSELPEKIYKYGETGFKNGGKFKPHKTHTNGLSVDFFTPMNDVENRSRHLPTTISNKFGYNIELKGNGEYKNLKIDYEAMAAHVASLHKSSVKRGFDLWRVIFDPQLRPPLYETAYGDYLKMFVSFSKKRSWVTHDDHNHVDFKIPCD